MRIACYPFLAVGWHLENIFKKVLFLSAAGQCGWVKVYVVWQYFHFVKHPFLVIMRILKKALLTASSLCRIAKIECHGVCWAILFAWFAKHLQLTSTLFFLTTMLRWLVWLIFSVVFRTSYVLVSSALSVNTQLLRVFDKLRVIGSCSTILIGKLLPRVLNFKLDSKSNFKLDHLKN